jgi:hypothetical protein
MHPACTCVHTPFLPSQQDLKNNWGRVQSVIRINEVRRLFQMVDFIGVSAYAGLPRYPTLSDLETSLRKVDQELGLFGMSLKGLRKEIIYSEYGELSSELSCACAESGCASQAIEKCKNSSCW